MSFSVPPLPGFGSVPHLINHPGAISRAKMGIRSVLVLSCVAAASAFAPGMRAPVRPAVSSRNSITTMKTYASIKEAQEAMAAEEAAAAAPKKAAKAPREPRAPREPPKPREPRATKAKAAPPAPPPPPLTAAEQRAALEAELAAIQASRKAAEAELKAAQAATKKAKGGVSLPSPTLPSISLPSAPKFDLTSSGKDASPLTGPGVYGLAAGLALGLVPAGALISARAFLMQRK